MKKDPVLWVVVDKYGEVSGYAWMKQANARADARGQKRDSSEGAPYRVVKYVPAPKTKKRKNAK